MTDKDLKALVFQQSPAAYFLQAKFSSEKRFSNTSSYLLNELHAL